MIFYKYGCLSVMPAPPCPIVQVPYERFTESDIQEFERIGVPREEIEHLNELMGFEKQSPDTGTLKGDGK